MSWRDKPLEVVAGAGIGPFVLGLTKNEVQALTNEPLESYFPQAWSKVRSDSHPHLGVTVSYDDDGVANHISGFVRLQHAKSNLVFEGERLREATRGTLKMLIELLGAEMQDNGDSIVVPSLGLKFGLREIDDEPGESDPCDYVVVEAKPE